MSSTRKRTARKPKKMRKTNKRRKPNKRHKIRKTSKRYLRGGSHNEDFLKQLNRWTPTFFREQLQKDCDTGDTNLNNLDKLKCNFTPDILEAYINRLIDAFNKDKMGWYTDDETTIPHKFSCSFIRQIYGSLIDSVIDEWIHITFFDLSSFLFLCVRNPVYVASSLPQSVLYRRYLY